MRVYTPGMFRFHPRLRFHCAALLLWLLPASLQAQTLPDITGQWVFNEKLSDSTDDQVEKALKAMGQKVKARWFSRDKEYYRGGPVEQELYDRISYDRDLDILREGEGYLFIYAGGEFERPVFLDDRSRSVSLTALDAVEDFSFAHWENDTLLVEARPRDGGFAEESYRLINGGSQLEASFYIKPQSFTVPVEIRRVFDRR